MKYDFYYLSHFINLYQKSTNTFILKDGRDGRFEVSVINCAEIWRKNSGEIIYSIYGKTNI
jgi:hypothetical protein